jgi:RimJ/RimL family protein N-acetyltransferase
MKSSLPLYTNSLVIRQFESADHEKVFQLSQDADMKRWLPDQVYEDQQEAENVLNFLISCYTNPETPRHYPYVLAVCLKSGELIGHVGLSPYKDQVEIGYGIGEDFQGSGYATEAVQAFTKWGIDKFDLNRIYGVVSAENIASCSVLEKAGFKFLKERIKSLHQQICLVKTYIK